MHRCQLYMFRTVTVHPQELLCRCCMCRLWYVVRNALSDTSSWYNAGQTLYQLDVSAHTIVCTYSIYKEAPEDGPLRSETCTAGTYASINNQCCNTVYLVGMYIYCKKWYTDLPMSSTDIRVLWLWALQSYSNIWACFATAVKGRVSIFFETLLGRRGKKL